MNPQSRQAVITALSTAYGYLLGNLKRTYARASDIPASTREMHDDLCRGMSAMLPSSSAHHRGAIAQCKACKRYTVSYFTESSSPVCECGSHTRWTSAFKPPANDAAWAISLDRAAIAAKESA